VADLCRGSGASPNPLYDAVVGLTASGVEAFLIRELGKERAAWLAPFLAGVTYLPTQICANPAPDDPGLNQNDMLALVEPQNPLVFIPAVNKLRVWFLAQYWSILCQCGDGLAPAVTTPSMPPPVSLSPGLPSAAPGSPCWDVQRSAVAPASGLTTLDYTSYWLPTTQTVAVQMINTDCCANAQLLPGGLTGVQVTVACDASTAGQEHGSVELAWFRADGGNIHIDTIIGSGSAAVGPATATIAIPSGATAWQIAIRTGSGTTSVDVHFTLTCSGTAPTQLTQPCCPPDAALELKLNEILGLVTLLQRQIAPFAYVPGASHTALTGMGELSVQGLLGVKVTPTTSPPGSGVVEGDPDVLWLDSWITWGNPDGWIEREFLRAAPHVSLPQFAGQFTKLGYTLRPGLTVNVTELVREP
jgi:hypothetical protein